MIRQQDRVKYGTATIPYYIIKLDVLKPLSLL